MFRIDNWDTALYKLRSTLAEKPEIRERAIKLPKLYSNMRGLMVVDVVASRQRRYENYVVAKLLPQYTNQAKDLSLLTLANNVPSWLPLKEREAQTMSEVATKILDFGRAHKISDENEMSYEWAHDVDAVVDMREVFGIGPALLEYLRMLCGADSLKVDVRVIDGLGELGLPIHHLTADGILALAIQLSREIPCTLIELDQSLWHVLGNKS